VSPGLFPSFPTCERVKVPFLHELFLGQDAVILGEVIGDSFPFHYPFFSLVIDVLDLSFFLPSTLANHLPKPDNFYVLFYNSFQTLA